MRKFIICVVVLLAFVSNTIAQSITNYVRNGDFERYEICPPDTVNTIDFASQWSSLDTFKTFTKGICFPEYLNTCNNATSRTLTVPRSSFFYQYPHSGEGMSMASIFCDESTAPTPGIWAIRDHLQGRLYANLTPGKSYCIGFYVNLAEGTSYATNKMGAYLDDGSLDTVSICSLPVTNVTPQMYTTDVMADTMNWKKIEGTFTASGNERFLTIGNFFPKDSITYYRPFTMFHHPYAYYLIDDVSVVESDLPADAGPDRWVEATKTVKIGRFNDTTATALDCQWYHKGMLIDSGATIIVAANATVGAKDTYVVVQTVCGLVKKDTVEVRTVPLGVQEWDAAHALSIFPNPSKGTIRIQALRHISGIRVYDLSGRVQSYPQAGFAAQTSLQLSPGMYIVEVETEDGMKEREKVLVE